MPNYYANLPAPEFRNALLDLSPVNNALSGVRQQNNENRNALLQQQQMDMRKEEQTYQRGRDAKQDMRQEVQFFGQQASVIDREQDPNRRAAMWQNLLKRHPNAASLTPDYLDPVNGPKMVMAEAGQWRDPREDQLKNLEIEKARAQIGLTQAQTAKMNKPDLTETDQRMQTLQRYGVDPRSPEGQMYLFNGKMPVKAYENKAYVAKQDGTIQGIEQGLQNLNAAVDTYDDASFTNAVGPIQGSAPDGLLSSLPVNAARLYGEVANFVQRGNTAPSEVRSKIVGDTEALAAAIKPLIRKPGEGVWTDQDQARLVSIVGDLAQSRDKEEYRRRLNNVRDRIKSNFNLDINFDAGADDLPAAAAPAQNRGGRTPSEAGDWRSTFKRVE